MRSQELRQAFIDFFVAKGHTPQPSATLIPDAMSTTLFTIAGMEQFVPMFLGERPAPAPRVVTVQRCLRVAGAKSDIENVGRTGRHGTFLEMLGNFSFGDYGKREALSWAWEFVTRVLGIDPAKLSVTVHTGDDEAARIWTGDIGLDPARVTRFDEDNFWTMGATGPCGPCSEIFYDSGAENADGPGDTGPNLGSRFVEIWNVVFQQYNRGADGTLSDLPRKAIDTGAGFERMLAVCNGLASMYETDLFADVIAAQPDPGRTSLSERERIVRRNIVADHARAITFLINDGVYPSNTDRGYVLRFLIRRAVRNGKLLGYPNGFLTSLVPAVVTSLEPGYPELREAAGRIAHAIALEEETFDRTLERGLVLLDRSIERANDDGSRTIGGADAFALHDTYGFPIELTREIAQERGVGVDAAGFAREMDAQRDRARRDATAKRAVVSLAEMPATRTVFEGYDGLESEGTVVALIAGDTPVASLERGAEGIVVLDRTSFYAERGGQIGDRGVLRLEGAVFDVADAQYMGEAIGHRGAMREGSLSVGDVVKTQVGERWRQEIRRHHTSAHLLQRALKDVLGDDVTQAGSWVGIDRMRFDFRWPSGALSSDQKRRVARRVNEMIRADSHLVTREMPLEEAKQTGAIWMAGEKYGDVIRVVQAGPSIEFCGGTHSHTTGELGMFLILSESSIGSGIRRIESCVSEAAEEVVNKQSGVLATLAASLATVPEEIDERIARMQRDLKDVQAEAEELKARLASAQAAGYVAAAERAGIRTFVGAVVPDTGAETLRHLGGAIRQRLGSGVVALAGIDDGSVHLQVWSSDDMIQAGVRAGDLVKLAAPLVGGRGGGQPSQAQGGGKNPAGANDAVRAMRDAVLQST